MAWFRECVSQSLPLTYQTAPQKTQRLLKTIMMHWASAPSTSEDITVTLISAFGAAYNTVIYTLDPASDSTTDVLLTDINLPIERDEYIRVEYASSDHIILSVQVVFSDGRA